MSYWVYRKQGRDWIPERSFLTQGEAQEYAKRQSALWVAQGIPAPDYKVCYGAETVYETA